MLRSTFDHMKVSDEERKLSATVYGAMVRFYF
jgi:hypothetical protein